jgi:hypothetical protein
VSQRRDVSYQRDVGNGELDLDAEPRDQLSGGDERCLSGAGGRVRFVGYEPDGAGGESGGDRGLVGVAVEELLVDEACGA